jgi:hypothetical protein
MAIMRLKSRLAENNETLSNLERVRGIKSGSLVLVPMWLDKIGDPSLDCLPANYKEGNLDAPPASIHITDDYSAFSNQEKQKASQRLS